VNLHCQPLAFTLADGFVLCRVAVTTVLDCLWPNTMNWYFRSPLRAKFLHTSADNNSPSRVKITLYRVGWTLLTLGYLLARVIKRNDDRFMNTSDLIAAGLGIW
jgi:hypothetical protein